MTTSVNRDDLARFRSWISHNLGLHFDDGKLDFLETTLRECMAAAGCKQFSIYEAGALASADEIQTIAERLTVCETYFFRYLEHFQVLTEVVIPARARARDRFRQLRILSAGCASGEEPYSAAILAREQPELAAWDVTIHGFDINPAMIRKAKQARYPSWSLRDMAGDLSRRYFCSEGRELKLNSKIKNMVTFEERNLVENDPSFWRPETFDVIFCRNVTMYLTPEATRSVIARIAASLTPEGFLFLGHAETLRGISSDFHLRHTHGTFYYQLRHESERENPPSFGGFAGMEPPRDPMGTPILSNDSWCSVIRRASERIANLTDGKNKRAGAAFRGAPFHRAPIPAKTSWDRTMAMALLQQEKFKEAIELLRELPPALQADPDAQLLLAVLLTNGGEPAEAEKICKQLLHLDELNAGAHYLMALCREHAGDRKQAIEHDQAAIYLDSAFAMPHLHQGLMAKRTADMETARRELSQALPLLLREDSSRIVLFGGGFTREALASFCQTELRTCGGAA